MRNFIVGIDEVGRGPLAGPVTLGGFITSLNFDFNGLAKLVGAPLRDSKKTTFLMRSVWSVHVQNKFARNFYLHSVSAKTIDKVGIRTSLTRGSTYVLKQLLSRIPARSRVSVYLDGSLYVSGQQKNLLRQELPYSVGGRECLVSVQTIIKGDQKIPVISLASIIAKAHRDRLMTRYERLYPGYGFAVHKGYGTARHLDVIRRLGPSHIHRLTFISKYLKVNPS